jgi:hypothetical protein
VVGSCEHGNEPSGSIKCGEFLDYLSVLLASQEGLCSMELVRRLVSSVHGNFISNTCKVIVNTDGVQFSDVQKGRPISL